MSMKYTNAIIDSTVKYLNNLQYLAKQDNQTMRDIHLLNIINDVYNYASWYEISESNKIKVRKIMDEIILNNSNLVLPKSISDVYELSSGEDGDNEIYSAGLQKPFGLYYTNVNTPQTIHTWQRIYDNSYIGNP